jgi:hypothetical protein
LQERGMTEILGEGVGAALALTALWTGWRAAAPAQMRSGPPIRRARPPRLARAHPDRERAERAWRSAIFASGRRAQ